MTLFRSPSSIPSKRARVTRCDLRLSSSPNPSTRVVLGLTGMVWLGGLLVAGCSGSDPPAPEDSALGAAGVAGVSGFSRGGFGGNGGKGGASGKGETSGKGGGGSGGVPAGSGGGGTGGAKGGSLPWGVPVPIGESCIDSVDCAGGTCFPPNFTEKNGSPHLGYCTVDCTDWYNLSDEERKAHPFPCDDSMPDLSEPDLLWSFICRNVASEGEPAKAYCFLSCFFGEPPIEAIDKISYEKCNGREDVVCYPISPGEDGWGQTAGYCRPYCQSDEQCDGNLKCDKRDGNCRVKVPEGKKVGGELCFLTLLPGGEVDPGGESECESGVCTPVKDPLDPDRKDLGVCRDPCILGSLESCGGPSSGLCLFPGKGEDASGKALVGGRNDLGFCAMTSPSQSDADCPWRVGWFLRVVSGKFPPVCLPAEECKEDSDCVASEQAPGPLVCVPVEDLCGRSFCLDHLPAGLPAVEPPISCGG